MAVMRSNELVLEINFKTNATNLLCGHSHAGMKNVN